MKVTLKLSEVPLHLYQVIAGFLALERKGEIELKIEKKKSSDPDRLPYNMLEAVVDGRSFIYDMNDGYDNLLIENESYIDLYNPLLDRCELLFKRSFNEEMNSPLSGGEKIRTTPPNMLVTLPGSPAHLPVSMDPMREKIKKIIRAIPFTQYYNAYVKEKNIIYPPTVSSQPRALFMARMWDPQGEFPGQLTEEKKQERADINRHRAACIRLCKKEFGEKFYGGVSPSAYTLREFSDIIVENEALSLKNRYLDFLKTFDVVISTMGLHKSTGWKFAEYIAASKAIVSEPMFYRSSGNLQDGKNFLLFTCAQECAENISQLLDDEEKRLNMMQENEKYYNDYMRSDMFIVKGCGSFGKADGIYTDI